MSDSNYIEKVAEVVSTVDLDVDSKPEEVVVKGPIERSVYALASNSMSNSNITIQNITPPSLTTITERCFRLQYSLLTAVSFPTNAVNGNYPFCNALVGSGVARAFPAGANAYTAGAYATDPVTAIGGANVGGGAVTFSLRAFPLQSTLSTLDLRINGISTSIPCNELVCLQPYHMDNEEIEYYSSEFPCQRDSGALYEVAVTSDNRNPLANWNQNSSTVSRASHMATLIYEQVNANVVYRVYQFDVTEMLAISPLVWGKCYNAVGFANISNITLSLNIQNINRAISAVPLAGYTANPVTCALKSSLGSITWNGDAQNVSSEAMLLMQYNTQDPILSARMSNTLYYDYDYMQTVANSNAISTALNNGSNDGSWTGNSLRINTIPDKIYVYIKPRAGQFTDLNAPTISDTFLRITKLQVNYNNRPNMLSSYTENDLYRMTSKNDVKMSWFEWQYATGSIVCIDVTSDLGLNSDEASGVNKDNSLQISGNFSCAPLRYAGITQNVYYDVVTVVVTQGKAIISPNQCQFTVGGVSTSEVLALTTSKDNVIASGLRQHFAKMNGRGGSMFGKLGKLLHHGLKFAKDNKDHISTGLDLATKGLEHLGLGSGLDGGELVAGKLRRPVKHLKHKRAY